MYAYRRYRADGMRIRCSPHGRAKGVQLVHNLHDSCCFGGNAAMVFKFSLEAAAKGIGGRINVIIDDTYFGHRISPATAERIALFATSGYAAY
jgi:hypothetical protein